MFYTVTPTVANDIHISITNKTDSTFTAKATSNLINPYYCLYDAADSLIVCNSSGVFSNIQNGSYCIKTKNACPDTTFKNCFTAAPSILAKFGIY